MKLCKDKEHDADVLPERQNVLGQELCIVLSVYGLLSFFINHNPLIYLIHNYDLSIT